MKAKRFSEREMKQILKDNGFVLDRTKGGHAIYVRNGKHISIPNGRQPNQMMFQRLVKENDLKID